MLRPFRPGLICPGCELPIDDSSSETVFALAGSPYRIALAKAKGLDEEQPIYIHRGCLICYCVVDPNTGTPCREADLAFNASFAPQNRINLNRHGLPVCCRHADDHALAVPTFAQSDVQKQKDFLDRYGFVKIVPDDNFPTEERWAEEHERVLHGFAAVHGIPFEEFKKRAGRDNWAASYLNDELLQESCMFGIFGTEIESSNELRAPFVQSRQAYAVRRKYLEPFANLLRVPDRSHAQTFSSGPCPYILIAKGATNKFPVSYLSPDTKCESKDRANPLLIMTGFTFFEETSRLLGGVSVAIGSVKVTKSNPVPFPKMVKTAFPRAQNQGHFNEHNPFVGSMVAIPTKPGEVIIIRSCHPYQFFSGERNHTGMILAASDITLKGNTGWTRTESVLNGVVRRGDQNRTVIKYTGKILPAPSNTPMHLPGVFDPVTSITECCEDVFGLGCTDPSTWPPECRPQPVPKQINIQTEKSRMSEDGLNKGKRSIFRDDDDEEIAPAVPEVVASPAKKKKEKKRAPTPSVEEEEEEEKAPSPEKKTTTKKKKKKAAPSPQKQKKPRDDEEEEDDDDDDDKGKEEVDEEQQQQKAEEQPVKKTPRKRAKKSKRILGEGETPMFSPDVSARPEGDVTFRRDNTLNPEFLTQPNKDIVKAAIAERIRMYSGKPFSGKIEFDEEEEGVLITTLNTGPEETGALSLKMWDVATKTCGGNAGLVEALAKEARRVMSRPRLIESKLSVKAYCTVYGANPVKDFKGTEFVSLVGAVHDMGKMLSPLVNRAMLIAGNNKSDLRNPAYTLSKLSMVSNSPSYVLCVGNSERDFGIRRNGQILCRMEFTPGLLIELPPGDDIDVCIPKKGRSEAVPEEPWGMFYFFTADEAQATADKGASSSKSGKGKSKKPSASKQQQQQQQQPVVSFTPEQRGKAFATVKKELDKLVDKYTMDELEAPEITPFRMAVSAAQAACAKDQGNTLLIWAFQDAFAGLFSKLTGKTWSNGRTAPPPDRLAVTPAPPAAAAAATASKGKKAKSPSPESESGSESSSSSGSSSKKKKAGSASPKKRAKKGEEERDVVEYTSMGETNLGAKNVLVGVEKLSTRKEVLHSDEKTVVRRSNREFKAPKELNKQAAAIVAADQNMREEWQRKEKNRKRNAARKKIAYVEEPYEAYKAREDAKAAAAAAKPKRGRDVYEEDDDDNSDIDLEEEDEEEDEDDEEEGSSSSDDDPFQKAEETFDAILEAHPELLNDSSSGSPAANTVKEIETLKKSLLKKESEEKMAQYISMVHHLAHLVGFEGDDGKDEDALYGKAKRGLGSIAAVAAASGTVNVIKKGFNADVDPELTGDFVDALLAVAQQHAHGSNELKELALAMRVRAVPEHVRFSAEQLKRFVELTDSMLSGGGPSASKKSKKKEDAPVVAVAVPVKKEEEEDDGNLAPMEEEEEEEEDDAAADPGPMEEYDDDGKVNIAKQPHDKDSESESSEPTVPSDDEDDDDKAQHQQAKDRPVDMSPAKPSSSAAHSNGATEQVYVSIADGIVLCAARGMDELRLAAKEQIVDADQLETVTKVVPAPPNWRDILRSMRLEPQPANLSGIEEKKLFPVAK